MSSVLPETRLQRCAVYTRKSFGPPLKQEVTSLESQRAICAAYVVSQQHKGWILADKQYEDSGKTGANLDRPALQDLLCDVELGLVDVVLVYKLDRITRTLLDFVRLIDFFDRFGVVFVAITQNFDTGDSLGRLIRNILLTFAQFEREIASDRIRDKKSVMRQRGLWPGGTPPLGYDLRRGKLVANISEAAAVRCLFETYVAKKSTSAAYRRLVEEGYRRKVWKSKNGVVTGGGPIGLSSLHHILRNPTYIGEIKDGGNRHPGIHEPIIDQVLWDQAQVVLKEREQFKPRQPRHLLTGLLFDYYGRRMVARVYNTFRSGSRRYYASAVVAWAVRQKVRKCVVRADQIERLILAALKTLLADRVELRRLLMNVGVHGPRLDELCGLGGAAAVRIDKLKLRQLSAALKVLIYRVEVMPEFIRLVVRPDALAKFVPWNGVGIFGLNDLEIVRSTRIHTIDIPAAVDREKRRCWLAVEPCHKDQAAPSASLLALLNDAWTAQRLIFENRSVSVTDLAWSIGRKPASFSRLVRLNYLAPDIVAAIIDGSQPPTLSRRQLIECDLPLDWALQRRLLGFPARNEHRPATVPENLTSI